MNSRIRKNHQSASKFLNFKLFLQLTHYIFSENKQLALPFPQYDMHPWSLLQNNSSMDTCTSCTVHDKNLRPTKWSNLSENANLNWISCSYKQLSLTSQIIRRLLSINFKNRHIGNNCHWRMEPPWSWYMKRVFMENINPKAIHTSLLHTFPYFRPTSVPPCIPYSYTIEPGEALRRWYYTPQPPPSPLLIGRCIYNWAPTKR